LPLLDAEIHALLAGRHRPRFESRPVLTVHLSEVRARKILSWLDLRGCIAKFQSSFSPHTFSFLITAAVLAIIVQVSVSSAKTAEPVAIVAVISTKASGRAS
jgi:hypothetical protein